MIYCDLAIDGVPIWDGKPCLNLVGLKWYEYIAFTGQLLFVDQQGNSDPTSDGLGTRYLLVYYDGNSADTVSVPLSAVTSQQLDATLGGQNCTLTLYEK